MGEVRGREPAKPLAPVVDPAAWYPDDLKRTDDWIVRLNAEDIAELDLAVERLHAKKAVLTHISRADFALPALGPKLDRARDEVILRRGVIHLRGLPVDRYDRWRNIATLCGIGTYFGDAVSQNHKGHLLGHVRSLTDKGMEVASNRAYNITGDALAFHCDSSDIVGLLSLTKAESGGETKIASSITIYNEMLKRRPDLAAELTTPFYRDRRGEVPPGKGPHYRMPVFMFHDGLLTVNFQGTYIWSAQRFEELPRFTKAQEEALRMFAALAEELCLQMPFEPGDFQFLHNHVIVHSRTEYHDTSEKTRHLLRLWLSTPTGRPLPAPFGDRSYVPLPPNGRPLPGVVVAGMTVNVPMEPE